MSWNEIEYVPWRQFSRMTPSILGLEITRLDALIRESFDNLVVRNALVRVRYELREFVADVALADSGTLSHETMMRLSAAILNVPLDEVEPGSPLHGSLRYILERLRSVHRRINYIYH